jgi:hypothetical protein
MSEMLLFAGLAGALLCLAGHLPGPVRRWGPQALALSGMALMAGGRAVPGVCAAGAACLWTVVASSPGHGRRWEEAIDLATMTLLMALMTGCPPAASHLDMTAGRPTTGPALLTVVVWITARSGGIMLGQVSAHRIETGGALPSVRRARACRESGATVMIVSMAAMLL